MKAWVFRSRTQVTVSQNESLPFGFTTTSETKFPVTFPNHHHISSQCSTFKQKRKRHPLRLSSISLGSFKKMADRREAKTGPSSQFVFPNSLPSMFCSPLIFTPEDTSSRAMGHLKSWPFGLDDHRQILQPEGRQRGGRTLFKLLFSALCWNSRARSPLLQPTGIYLSCHTPVVSSLLFS